MDCGSKTGTERAARGKDGKDGPYKERRLFLPEHGYRQSTNHASEGALDRWRGGALRPTHKAMSGPNRKKGACTQKEERASGSEERWEEGSSSGPPGKRCNQDVRPEIRRRSKGPEKGREVKTRTREWSYGGEKARRDRVKSLSISVVPYLGRKRSKAELNPWAVQKGWEEDLLEGQLGDRAFWEKEITTTKGTKEKMGGGED